MCSRPGRRVWSAPSKRSRRDSRPLLKRFPHISPYTGISSFLLFTEDNFISLRSPVSRKMHSIPARRTVVSKALPRFATGAGVTGHVSASSSSSNRRMVCTASQRMTSSAAHLLNGEKRGLMRANPVKFPRNRGFATTTSRFCYCNVLQSDYDVFSLGQTVVSLGTEKLISTRY